MVLHEIKRRHRLLATPTVALPLTSLSPELLATSRTHPPFFAKSLACMFRVMLGSLTISPSSSGAILTWQPSRLVSVRPNARSSMSFSSSVGSGIASYMPSSSTMTWHVEHAHEPPQAPVRRRHVSKGSSRRERGQKNSGPTFHLEIVGLRDVEQVVPVRDLESVLISLLVNEGDPPFLTRLRGFYVPVAGRVRGGEGPESGARGCGGECESGRRSSTNADL